MAYASQNYVKDLLKQTLVSAKEQGLLGGGNVKTDNSLDELKFGTDADGNYGYYKKVEGADTFVPFKSNQEIELVLLATGWKQASGTNRYGLSHSIVINDEYIEPYTNTQSDQVKVLKDFDAKIYITSRAGTDNNANDYAIFYVNNIEIIRAQESSAGKYNTADISLKVGDIIRVDQYSTGTISIRNTFIFKK